MAIREREPDEFRRMGDSSSRQAKTARLWRATMGCPATLPLKSPATAPSSRQDGKTLATVSDQLDLFTFHRRTGAIETAQARRTWSRVIAISPDLKVIAAVGGFGLFDVETGRELATSRAPAGGGASSVAAFSPMAIGSRRPASAHRAWDLVAR